MAKEHKLKYTGEEVEARLEKVTEIDKGKMERPTTGKKGKS